MGVRVTVDIDFTVPDRMTAAAAQGVALASEFLLDAANAHVPIEEGTLLRSGVADHDGLEASVSYDTPYAARQHEELDYQHDEGRTPKWLTNAVVEDGDVALQIIASTIETAT